jgi:dephospho-CoA kinase
MNLRTYIRALLLENMSSAPKVIFMAGGPGSGKSTTLRRLGLANIKIINPDDMYEEMLTAEGIPLDRNKIFSDYGPVRREYLQAKEEGDTEKMLELEPEYERLRALLSRNMVLFNRARADAKKRKLSARESRENYIVDGTGGNFKEILKQFQAAKDAGYDPAMIYVHVPQETSVERDMLRGQRGKRSLGRSVVERSWQAVNNNLDAYRDLFENNFFMIRSTDDEFETTLATEGPKIERYLNQ